MKNILLVFVIVACLLQTSLAQVNFGFKAGLNLSKISGDWDHAFGDFEGSDLDFSPKFKTGLFIGAFVELGVSEKFAIQPEAMYSMKGVRFQDSFEESGIMPDFAYNSKGDLTIKFELNYIEIPVFFKYRTTEGLTLGAGPYLGILTSAKSLVKANINYTINTQGTTITEKESFNESQNVTEYIKTIDFGFVAGLGYEFPFGLGIDFRFAKGILEVFEDNPGDPFTNTNLQFGLSYTIINN
jgi:hypothetical protein